MAAPCPKCGSPSGVAHGRAHRDGAPYVVYLLDWCEGADPERKAVLTLSIGDWSDGAPPSSRSTVALDMTLEGWRLTDEPSRDQLPEYGEFVGDAEVRRRDAVDQVRAIARLVMAGDPNGERVIGWIGGGESALPPVSGKPATG